MLLLIFTQTVKLAIAVYIALVQNITKQLFTQLRAWFLLYCGKMFLNLELSTAETKEEDSLNFTFANNKKVSGPSSPPPPPVSVPLCEVVSGGSL